MAAYTAPGVTLRMHFGSPNSLQTWTRLTVELFEDDLVWRLGPWPPVVSIRRSEDDHGWRINRGGHVSDTRIIPDKQLGLGRQSGDLG